MLDSRSREQLERFEANDLERLSHLDHVRVAWAMLRRDGLKETLRQYPEALRRFAASRGADDLYNETITWLYLFLISERSGELDPAHGWTDFAESNPDLLVKPAQLLARYYSGERLGSTVAKATFVLPDRAPEREAAVS